MKIAVITFPLINNYGGIIQAYALIELLKEIGHQPVLVNLQSDSKIKALSKYFIKNYIFSFYKKNKKYPKLVQDEKLKRFILNNITPKTIKLKNSKELHRYFKHETYDACIVGSDQVFSSMGFTNFKGDFSLGFLNDNIIKLSYAASFGGNTFRGDKDKINFHSKNLKRFKAISVREKSAVNICKELFDVNSTHVLDPALMIDATKYLHILGYNNFPEVRNELFAYVLDSSEDKKLKLSRLAEEKSIVLNQLNDGNKSGKVISMENWLESILLAKHVITDSFHGCVFCILFNKPFNCFVNEERGADRFYSLLQLFGLENRIIEKNSDKTDDSDINWKYVNDRLAILRKESKDFLVSNLLES